MDRKELLNYAIKGLGVEIAEAEGKIEKGYKVIDKINRNMATTEKSKEDILETIEKYQQKINELRAKRDTLLFDEMMAETDKQTQTREENIIKVALSSILSNDTKSLGNLFIEEMIEILNKIALKPYCERIGKRYDLLTDDDRKQIEQMQMADYEELTETEITED